MAQTEKIVIQLEDKTKIQSARDTVGKAFQQAQAGGAFSGKAGQEASNKIGGLLQHMDSLLKNEKLSAEQMKDFQKTMKSATSILTEFSSKMQSITSDEIKKLKEEVDKLTGKLEQQKDTVKASKTTRDTARADFTSALAGKQFYKLNKEGNLSNVQIKDINKIAELLNTNPNSIGYKDAEGKIVKGKKMSATLGESAQTYINSQKAVDENTAELKKINEQLAGKTEQYTQALSSEAAKVTPGSPDAAALQIQKQAAEALETTNLENNQVQENAAATEEQKRLTEETDKYTASLNQKQIKLGKVTKMINLYKIAMNLARKVVNSSIKTITDLDKYLTEQAMVTGKTREETYALLGTYQKMAKQLGATTKEVANVATQYLRQGKSVEEATQLTEAAISAAKVAGISATESVDYLTTALNGFQLAAEDAMKVSDKFAAVAASAAVSYEEIAVALSKVASQANLAGMSIDYTTALLTKGIETTREAPETIGTALKTVIARMREMSDYGETLEGDTDVNNVETQLAYVDIALKNANGELRSTEDVLNELGQKWDTLNTNQQAAVAKALAGTRQQSRLIAMMTDYERVIELQEISERSAGATMAQMETYLTGLDAATNKVKVAWESIVTGVTNSDLIIGVVSTLGNFLENLSNKLWIIYGILIAILAISVAMIPVKLQQWKLQIAINAVEREEQINKLKELIQEGISNGLEKKKLDILNAQLVTLEKETVLQKLLNWITSQNPIGLILTAIAAIVVVLTAVILLCVDWSSKVEKVTEKVSELSSEIYNLNKKLTSIDDAIDKFEELDNKILKTKTDLEEMSSELSTIADSLSTDADNNIVSGLGDTSEQDYYNSLSTDAEKLAFLKRAQVEYEQAILNKRQEQLKLLRSLNDAEREEAWNTETNVDAVKAINNSKLYEYIDALEDVTDSEADAIEDLTQTLLENVSASEAWDIVNDPERIQEIINKFKELDVVIDDISYNMTEILGSEDFSLKEQVQAYKELEEALKDDAAALAAFQEQYNQYEVFYQMGEDVLDFIEKVGLSIDELNDLYDSVDTLRKAGIDITEEQYKSRYQAYLQSLTDFDGDVAAATKSVFGDFLATAEDYETAWNALINNFGNLVEVGITNMGQNIDKFKNSVSDFYETASEWGTMSETDKTQFISDNAELFSGESGKELLEAFNSGNYNVIEQALSSNDTLIEQRQDLLDQVEQELKVELAREGDDYNAAYVAQLKEYKAYLEDYSNLYKASLEVRLEQEENALDQYKSLLQDEQDALTESLEKRKEAYQDYFDAINETAEDEDYEEQAELLITNLNKLATSTDASSQKQSKELEQQLKELEEERLETLRERAQEAIMENIDDTLDQINDKFDELLNSNKLLLEAFTNDISSDGGASLVARSIANGVSTTGLTATGLEDLIQNLQTQWGSYLTGVDWDNITVAGTDVNNNLILNVNGQEIVLSQDSQQSMYEAIMAAMIKAGVK